MNLLLIIVILLFLVLAVVGLNRGFLKCIMPVAALLIASVLLVAFAPHIRDALIKHTEIDEKLSDNIRGKLEDVLKPESTSDDEDGSTASPASSLLPEGWKALFGSQPDFLGLSEGEDLLRKVSDALASVILTAMVYVFGLPVLYVILLLIGRLMGLFTEMPILKQTDQMLGLLLGVVVAFILTEFIMFVITGASHTEYGQKFMTMISESSVLRFFYRINLMKVLFR